MISEHELVEALKRVHLGVRAIGYPRDLYVVTRGSDDLPAVIAILASVSAADHYVLTHPATLPRTNPTGRPARLDRARNVIAFVPLRDPAGASAALMKTLRSLRVDSA
jgi:hypothetical protein